jgi:hypothetical protein
MRRYLHRRGYPQLIRFLRYNPGSGTELSQKPKSEYQMKKNLIALLCIVGLSSLSCTNEASLVEMMERGKPVRSSFIGRKLTAFELYAGPTYKWKNLPNGDSIQYWRSDIAGFGASRGDDGQGTLCRLIILTDAQKYIKEIRVVEDGIACGPALR